MSRKLSDLDPLVGQLAAQLKSKAAAAGVPIVITATLRTKEEQDALYELGRSLPGAIVTNAKGGESYHNYGLAFDFVPLKDGKADWNDSVKFLKVGAIAKEIGLEWGGSWKFRDLPHCQYSFGLSIADLQAGKRPPAPTAALREETHTV